MKYPSAPWRSCTTTCTWRSHSRARTPLRLSEQQHLTRKKLLSGKKRSPSFLLPTLWSISNRDGVVVPCGRPAHTGIRSSCSHNEYIIYDTAQCNIRYLLKVKFHHKYWASSSDGDWREHHAFLRNKLYWRPSSSLAYSFFSSSAPPKKPEYALAVFSFNRFCSSVALIWRKVRWRSDLKKG